MARFLKKLYGEVALRAVLLIMVLIILVMGMINPIWTINNLIKDNHG